MDAGRSSTLWVSLFVLAVAAVIGSLVAVGLVIFRASDDPVVSGPGPAQAGDDDPGDQPLTYFGPLPASLEGEGLVLATDASSADILIQRANTPKAVPVRYFVPVVSFQTGLDAVTEAELNALIAGETSFAALGGRGGPAHYLSTGVAEDARLVAEWAGITGESVPGGYTELLAAIGARQDAIAFIPLDLVDVRVLALAVDGMDPVRGRGDLTSWPFSERMELLDRSQRGKAALPVLQAKLGVTLPEAVTVVATGDILQTRCSLSAIRATGDWGAALRGPMAEYLAAADLALGSLDTSIQDIGEPYGCVSGTNLTAPAESIEALTLAGFDEVSVATNHVFDCGQIFCGNRAFLRTLELLEQAGIEYAGGGHNLEEALTPVIFDVDGTTFGILAFDDIAAYELEATETEPGTAPLDDSYGEERAAGEPAFFRPAEELSLERFTSRIQALKQQVDVVIVQVQTGTEDTHDPSPRSVKALRAAADAGADLVIGNQAHHAQAVEIRGDVFIAYALGNFIFDQVWTPEHTQGYLVEATFWGSTLANVRLVPYEIVDKYRPTFVESELRSKILEDVFSAAERLPSGQ